MKGKNKRDKTLIVGFNCSFAEAVKGAIEGKRIIFCNPHSTERELEIMNFNEEEREEFFVMAQTMGECQITKNYI